MILCQTSNTRETDFWRNSLLIEGKPRRRFERLMRILSFSTPMVCPLPTTVMMLTSLGLVTGQIADEIEGISRCIEQLYGILNEESLKLR